MIELPEGVRIDEPPIEKRYRSVTAGLLKRIKTLYDTIYEKYGEEGLELIRDVSRKYGLEIAERAKKRVKTYDTKSVALYLIRIFNTVRGNGKVTKFTDDEVRIIIYECPYPFDKPEVCKAHITMEETLVETLGENLHYSTPRLIPKGDSYCEQVITRSKE